MSSFKNRKSFKKWWEPKNIVERRFKHTGLMNEIGRELSNRKISFKYLKIFEGERKIFNIFVK